MDQDRDHLKLLNMLIFVIVNMHTNGVPTFIIFDYYSKLMRLVNLSPGVGFFGMCGQIDLVANFINAFTVYKKFKQFGHDCNEFWLIYLLWNPFMQQLIHNSVDRHHLNAFLITFLLVMIKGFSKINSWGMLRFKLQFFCSESKCLNPYAIQPLNWD